MLTILNLFAMWFDANYEKIWLWTCIVAAALFLLGIVSGNEFIYGVSEDVTDFYDEILSE